MNIDEKINEFRLGKLDIDCKHMTLIQAKEGGEFYEGQGYIRQTEDGILTFKIYVTKKENAVPFAHLNAQFRSGPGKFYPDDAFYDLTATSFKGTTWTAHRILLNPDWDMSDDSVIIRGQLNSVIGRFKRYQKNHYVGLHFFEEYEVPLNKMSKTERDGNEIMVLDRIEFEACDSKFEVMKRGGSGYTFVEATSENPFPQGFHQRIQEAIQFLTGESALWRARIATEGDAVVLELASQRNKSPRSKLYAPLLPTSAEFRNSGWTLFSKFLAYTTKETTGSHWNPVAYHLFGARESSGNSIEAWAVGASVALEALASLIQLDKDKEQAEKIKQFQKHMRDYVSNSADYQDLAERFTGLVNMMGSKSAKDSLYWLAEEGRVEKDYIKSWSDLRNKHVHPSIRDLKKPEMTDYQDWVDDIRRVGVLLNQISFHLIGYSGPYTDYGAENFPTKTYHGRH